MSANTDAPLGRTEAFARLRGGLASVADLAERLDAAQDDAERRSVLLFLITAAWQAHDAAGDAYSSLDRERDDEGIAKGVLE